MSDGQAVAKPAPERPAVEVLASIRRRLLAWIVDVVLVTLLVFAGVTAVDAVLGPAVTFRPEAATLPDTVALDKGLVALEAVVAAVLSAGYFVLPWTRVGGSPAQLALRVRVGGEADWEALPLGRAVVRWVLLFPPFATVSALAAGEPLVGWLVWGGALAWYALLLLTTAVSETKQGLHDAIARSVVRKHRAAAG